MTTGKLISEARKEAGFTQEQLALPIGPATKAEAVAVAQTLKLVTGRR